jgi:hypothetical protein
MKGIGLILITICALAAVIAGASGELGRLLDIREPSATASAGSAILGVLSEIWLAASELWEIARLHHLGVWHAIVITLAVLIPRKILVSLLR